MRNRWKIQQNSSERSQSRKRMKSRSSERVMKMKKFGLPVLSVLAAMACTSPYDDPTEVARLYWTAMAEHDADGALKFSTDLADEFDLSELDYDVSGVELVVAAIDGDEANVSTTINATVEGMHLTLEFETALVEENDRWLVDIETTSRDMVSSFAASLVGEAGLAGALAQGLEGSLAGLGDVIGEAVGSAMEGAFEGLAQSELFGQNSARSRARDRARSNRSVGIGGGDRDFGFDEDDLSMRSGWAGVDVTSFGEPIVSLTRIGDNENVREGFTLTRAADLRVLALGEGTTRMYDYGWISNIDTHEMVWEMDLASTSHAGGGRSNRMVNEVLSLEAGNYMVNYRSDGNTSFEDRWAGNGPPTHENFWGITVMLAGDLRRGTVTEYEPPEALVQIVRVGDNENRGSSFELSRRTQLRVYAIGEISGPSSRYDYGYIVDAATGNRVWQMEYSDTQPAAGGRSSDRIANTIITLPAGRYSLHYQSDGSHSYRDYDGVDPDAWGISLYEVED